jgi:hypothetical protein
LRVKKIYEGGDIDRWKYSINPVDSPGSRTDVREGLQSSFNATAKNSVNVTAPVEMQGTDAHGRACESKQEYFWSTLVIHRTNPF